LRECSIHDVDHFIRPHENIAIPEPDHTAAMLLKPARAHFITLVSIFLSVTAAIHFDDQARFGTKEIGEVRPYRRLPPKTEAGQLFSAKQRPQSPFGIRHVPAQFTRASDCRRTPPSVWLRGAHAPLASHLPPQGGKGNAIVQNERAKNERFGP
jgi:hypothetical protein